MIENIPCHATLFQCHTHEWVGGSAEIRPLLFGFVNSYETLDDP